MRFNLLSYAGGLGLMVGALLWPSVSRAQGFCYMVNSEGQVINLNELCQSNNNSGTEQSQGQATGTGESLTEPQNSSSPESRTYTIIGPAVDPDSTEQPTGATAETPGVVPNNSGPNAAGVEDSVDTTPERINDSGNVNNRLDIPVREIDTPEISNPPTRGTTAGGDRTNGVDTDANDTNIINNDGTSNDGINNEVDETESGRTNTPSR